MEGPFCEAGAESCSADVYDIQHILASLPVGILLDLKAGGARVHLHRLSADNAFELLRKHGRHWD